MKPLVSMREALDDPQLLGNILSGDSWSAWRAVLIAAMGEKLTPAERRIFKKLSGGRSEPGVRVDELWAVVGRRGGKSRAASVLASYLGGLVDHSDVTAFGEKPLVLAVSQNQRTAGVVFGYAAGAFESSPMLASLVTNRTADTLELSTGVNIEVRAASARGLRGVTCAAVIGDEACFWNTDGDSVNADSQILTAVRPTLATTGGPLIVISSPFAKRGEVYETWRQHYGPKGDKRVLVVQGASRDFNSSLPKAVVDRALKRDEAAAKAEYLGQWRDDVETFLTADVVDGCVVPGRTALPPGVGVNPICFVDVSGGVHDSHVCSVAVRHPDTDKATLAALREIKSPDTAFVVREFASLIREYGISEAWSDRYGSRWVWDAFEREGIRLRYSTKSRSDIFIEALHAMRSRRVELLDQPRLRNQLLALQRRTTTTGRDIVDHASNGHDDVANAACGALALAAEGRTSRFAYLGVERRHFGVFEPADMTGADWDAIAARIVCGPQPETQS